MKLLIVILLGLAQGTSFSLLERCACSTYQQVMCSNVAYCSWVNNACVDLQCSTVSQNKCSGSSTEYKCGWNSSKNVCENKTYSCSDFTSSDTCTQQYGFDCVWQTSTSKCLNFTCTGIDKENCDYYRCSYVSGTCGQPQPVDCATQTSCSSNRPGSGTTCALNDNKVCKSYNILPKNCSDYSDISAQCQEYCTYESSTKTCRAKQCSDLQTSIDCTFLINPYYFTYTPCYWSGSSCSEATNANISTFVIEKCLEYTAVHYTWDLNAGKCVQCTTYSKFTLMSTYDSVINGGSTSKSGIIFMVILSMLFLD